MMEIALNDIFQLSNDELNNSRIELNMKEGPNGVAYIDKWLNLDEDVKCSGITDCSYWGWYGTNRNFSEGQTVFSFIKLGYNKWLFISAATIITIPINSRAKVEIIQKYKPMFGRLIINYNKGNTYARYVFKMSNLINEINVKEILSCKYNGEQFNGYDNVHLPYHKLSDVFNGNIMPTYYEALRKVTGVYCLTDTNTGKHYIGSATGGDGVAGRWDNYLDSKHGGNKKLILLYNDNGAQYFENYFTFTLIEYFGMSYDAKKINQREQYWKHCLIL